MKALQYRYDLAARKKSGLRQFEIAERMGIPQSNVSRIEHQTDALTYKTFAAYLRGILDR